MLSSFKIDGFVINRGCEEEEACEANFGFDRAAHMLVERVRLVGWLRNVYLNT